MIIKTLSLCTLLLFSATALKAENHMLILGGGGEPTGASTIFDSTMKILGTNLKSTNWKYQASFNGGHAETEQMLATSYAAPEAPTTNFTTDNYNKMIADYKAKILMGQIKPGDQLMIIMNTHGAAKSKNEKTHLVAASGGTGATDLNSLTGTKLVSMDALEELVKLSNERGINLGLVDLSCHSGNTQALKANAPNTCIITATGPKHYGFAGESAFSGTFMKNLKKGVTLEGAFLKARTESRDASFPMISTDENAQIVAEVYSSITPYLYFYEPEADKLTDYIIATSKDCINCKRDSQFAALISTIERLQQASTGTRNGFNGEELKKLLVEYKAQQDQMIRAQKALGIDVLSKKENFSASIAMSDIVKGKKVNKVLTFERKNMSWNEIIDMDPDDTIRTFEGYRDRSKSATNKADNQVVIDGWKKIKAKKEEILSQYPKLKNLQIESKNIVKQIGANRDIAEKIAMQEKKLYDELYRQKQSLNTNDPCRKIVF